MNEKYQDSEEPSSIAPKSSGNSRNGNGLTNGGENNNQAGFMSRFKKFMKTRQDTSLREAIEEYIEEADNDDQDSDPVVAHERLLISNILNLRDMTVVDIMIPRADIVAIDITTSQKDLLSLLSEKQFSRIPVYRESTDDIVGTIHIKDILAGLAQGKQIKIENLVRDVPLVSPAMTVMDLLLMMRQLKKHMVLVVDEFGGIDGLCTVGDVIEAVVGEIEDEYDTYEQPQIVENKDGSLLVDARLDIDEFEEKFSVKFDVEESEDVDTLGGLVFAMTGRVPARGEILTHNTGMVFEIVDADPRRVNRLMIKNIPLPSEHSES